MRGFLQELRHETGETIEYQLRTGDDAILLREILGRRLKFEHDGKKACIHCGRRVKKLYQNGYCFPCVTSLAQCDLCIVKPHECHFHLGTCRDEQFAMTHCMIPHYVYIAYSSSIKVGLTRKGRQLQRWVDQGATAAAVIAEVNTRKAAGELEMSIAQHVPDKTDWRKMLQNVSGGADEVAKTRQWLLNDSGVRRAIDGVEWIDDETIHVFNYPRLAHTVVKTTSLSLDKEACVEGTLLGVKGQYLVFEQGVLNVKKHVGYSVSISISG